jgi:hypothetical protein
MHPSVASPDRPLPSTIRGLGWTSFLTDLSSEAIYPLLPAFVMRELGGSAMSVGLLDGSRCAGRAAGSRPREPKNAQQDLAAAYEKPFATGWPRGVREVVTERALLNAGKRPYCRSVPVSSTAMKAFCGMSTEPMLFIRFLPSFCFAHSFFLREISPP